MTDQSTGKFPIDRPCSACSAGDSEMKYHDHSPPFRVGYGPEAGEAMTKDEAIKKLIQEVKLIANCGSVEDFTVAGIRCTLRDALYRYNQMSDQPTDGGGVAMSDHARKRPIPKNYHIPPLGYYFCNLCHAASDTEYCGKCGKDCEGAPKRRYISKRILGVRGEE